MVDSLSLVRGAWVVMIALLAVLFLEIDQWRRDLRYNAAVAAGDYDQAAAVATGPRADAALAAAMPDSRFEDRVVLLSRLSEGGTQPGDALYNLANLYLRRALSFEAGEDQDVVVPLVQQAKQHYRTILRDDPGHMAAKYNLTLALVLLPETALLEADEESNPERSERAISTMRVEEQLP